MQCQELPELSHFSSRCDEDAQARSRRCREGSKGRNESDRSHGFDDRSAEAAAESRFEDDDDGATRMADVVVCTLLSGKPEGDSIIVMDCCPLPVEGSETRVVADDAQVYMTQLMDSMELRRKEGFVGWYHSHPFDVETYSSVDERGACNH